MAKCPFCGEQMVNGVCRDCGYREYNSTYTNDEILGEAVEKESKVVYDEQPRNQYRVEDKVLGSLWKWIFVFISIFGSSFLGLIISIVLITRPYLTYKSFGWKLLILNIVLIIISIILGLFVGALAFLGFGVGTIIDSVDNGGTLMNLMMML